MSTSTFSRILEGLFPGNSPAKPSASLVAATSSTSPVPFAAATAPIVVGQGGENERQVTIAGVPMLFRDEGDVVVQFQPDFDYDLRQTPVGMKLIPSLAPHWAVVREHRNSLTAAIATAIKAAAEPMPRPELSAPVRPERVKPAAEAVVENAAPASPDLAVVPTDSGRTERPRFGSVKEWGEKDFPDGKRPGKTYTSFCLTLSHRGQDQILQGEGLRDAIADTGCKIGDRVEVRRLGKIKVPAVDGRGRPKLDAQGAQVLWDKWLWKIIIKS